MGCDETEGARKDDGERDGREKDEGKGLMGSRRDMTTYRRDGGGAREASR